MKVKWFFSLVPFILFFIFYFAVTVLAEDCDPNCSGIEECQRKISECQKRLEMSVSATKPHEEKAVQLEKDIASLEANVLSLGKLIAQKKVEIA